MITKLWPNSSRPTFSVNLVPLGPSLVTEVCTFATGFLRPYSQKYSVTDKVAIPYHPQTSSQLEISNMEIKHIDKRRMLHIQAS
jgi:hypothetical protein